MKDPRYYQLSILTSLLLYGVVYLDFNINHSICAAMIVVAMSTQYVFTRFFKLPFFEPKSALITSLSLCLLLRTNSLSIACLAALMAVASKFLIRINSKHVFNPSNFSLVILLIFAEQVWVSPGQWGQLANVSFLIACLGMLVIYRTKRSDVTIVFITTYILIIIGRAVWLGDPLYIPLHQLQNGALLLFAFFMISDPMTAPNHRAGRILFSVLVACLGAYLQFAHYETNGLLYALCISSLFVPLIDYIIKDEKYVWIKSDSIIKNFKLINKGV